MDKLSFVCFSSRAIILNLVVRAGSCLSNVPCSLQYFRKCSGYTAR